MLKSLSSLVISKTSWICGSMLHRMSRPAQCVDLLVERDELAQGGAGQILDVAEVEQQFAPAQFVDEAEELFADDLDVLFIEDFLVDEIDDGDVADVFYFQSPPPRLRGHAASPSFWTELLKKLFCN